MVLIRWHDYHDMNFFERRKTKESNNWYVTDKLTDVNLLMNLVNDDVIFDKKTTFFGFFQRYLVFVQDRVLLEMDNKNYINEQNRNTRTQVLLNLNVRDKIEQSLVKSQNMKKNYVTTIYDPVLSINSFYKIPILLDFFNVPQKRRPKKKNNLVDLIKNISKLPELIPIPDMSDLQPQPVSYKI